MNCNGKQIEETQRAGTTFGVAFVSNGLENNWRIAVQRMTPIVALIFLLLLTNYEIAHGLNLTDFKMKMAFITEAIKVGTGNEQSLYIFLEIC